MRLSEALAPQVSARTRARGAEYAAAGAVTSIEPNAGILHAIVEGSDDYEVFIEAAGSRLHISCTCPYFLDHGEICKHIWAAILAAETRGIPLIEPGRVTGAVTLCALDLDDLDGLDDLDEDDWDVTLVPPSSRMRAPVTRPQAAARRRPPPWQRWLEEVVAIGAAPAAPARIVPGQLLYVIDVDASRAARVATMELMTRDRKVSGEWGKPKPARISALDVERFPPGADRDILQRLLGVRVDYASGYTAHQELSRFKLDGVLLQDLLPVLCAEGRCLARVAPSDAAAALSAGPDRHRRGASESWQAPRKSPPTLSQLQFDYGPAWRLDVRIRRDEAAAEYRIEGSLARDGERMDVSEPLLVLAGGLLVTSSHVARLDHGGAFVWLAQLRQTPVVTVPFEARLSLLDALLVRPVPLEEAPDELRFAPEARAPQPTLQLTPSQWRDRLEANVTMRYDDLHVSPLAPQPLLRSADGTRIVRRDIEREHELLATLQQLGFRQEWSPKAQAPVPQLPVNRFPRVIRVLLSAGWHVEAQGVTYRHPGTVRLSVSSGIDWFDVDGGVDYDGQEVSLPALLAAVRRGDDFVTLGDGTHGLLPEEWLRRHGALARLGVAEETRLRFKPAQIALLDTLLAAQPAVSCDEAFASARRQLASFDGIQPVDPPASFAGALRGYQREGLGWLLFLRQFGFGGCLADDMGLGKTVMVLALLARVYAESAGNRRPSLVVAPRSLVFNWRQEAARFAPALRVLDYSGGGRSGLREQFPAYDLILTTYGTLRRDAADLAGLDFEYVVLDEAQAIKNATSASAKAARLLRTSHRLALSGTPIENHLGELWSLFEFLNPDVLGSAAAFSAAGATSKPDQETVALLSRGLRPFILRRTKAQVAPELPSKTEQTVYCELERPQRRLYDELKEHYRQTLLARVNGGGLGRAKLQVLEALLRLRQAACHPGLIDPKRTAEPSAKLDVLVPHLLQAIDEGHKTLVFSQFTSMLAIVRRALDTSGISYEYLDGRTRDREARVTRFQNDPECRLFLISLKAGGVGLNLTAAEYVFLLDPWWNPAVEAQAIDRTHRIGQSRQVFAYRLIAKDTVEERVLQLQQHKRSLADAVLSADESILRTLRREDLELLLS